MLHERAILLKFVLNVYKNLAKWWIVLRRSGEEFFR